MDRSEKKVLLLEGKAEVPGAQRETDSFSVARGV